MTDAHKMRKLMDGLNESVKPTLDEAKGSANLKRFKSLVETQISLLTKLISGIEDDYGDGNSKSEKALIAAIAQAKKVESEIRGIYGKLY